MLRPRDDDLFKDSTMTFGEHLEELRASLMKAVLSIGIGTIIGFFLGQRVVDVITAPLQRALVNYYQARYWDYYQTWSQQQQAAGKTPPYSLQEAEHLLFDRGLIYQIHYVHPHVVAGTLRAYWRDHPQAAGEPNGNAVGQAPARAGRSEHTAERKQSSGKGARDAGGRQSQIRGDKHPGSSRRNEAGADGSSDSGGQRDGARHAGTGRDGGRHDRPQQPGARQPSPEIAGGIEQGDAATMQQADESSLLPLFAWYPLREDSRIKPSTLGAPEGFMIYLKASLVVGIIISSPFAFYFIWSFIAAGLYPHEKRYVYVFAPFSLMLFLSGAALAYFFVFGPVLNFLFDFNRSLGLEVDLRISEWLSFVLLLPLGFGVSFQLPLVMLFLERLGILSVQAYLAKWRIAVMVIVVLSAVLTPADPISVWFMLVPLLCLYFGGILLCKWMPRIRRPA